jgi:hypothetical protein
VSEVAINISWEYFLGIMGALLGIAWYSNGRFTKLETSMGWVKETLKELKTASDNDSAKAFESNSPVNLNQKGEKWLEESGLKDYIEAHKDELLPLCQTHKETNPYEVQKHVFQLFDELKFEDDFENKLKAFAFAQGTTMNIMRRVAAIHFRNLCLNAFGMKTEDIDQHDPGDSGF